MDPQREKIDPVLLILLAGILFFTLVLFVSEKFFEMDGQLFQVIAGLLTGFSGAFFVRIKSKGNAPDSPPEDTAGIPKESLPR